MCSEIDLDNPIGLGCALETFQEVSEVNEMISKLAQGENDVTALECLLDRFVTIVDYYQEQPHLLDRNIPEFFQSLLSVVMNKEIPVVSRHHAFKLMYYFTKTRGYKNILKLLPHEVSDLPLALQLLHEQDETDKTTWESRYMLFIWLSVIILIPFEMSRFDGTSTERISQKLIDTGFKYLSANDATRDAASYFLAQFLIRPDIVRIYLVDLLEKCTKALSEECDKKIPNVFLVIGIIRCLALIFKHGKREELVDHASDLYLKVKQSAIENNSNVLFRKFCCKLYHRLCLVHLKTKIVSWRYQKGARSLAVTLNLGGADGNLSTNSDHNPSGDTHQIEARTSKDVTTPEEEDCEIHEDVESVLNDLLSNFLKDNDTTVRWSAAKSIGRITSRLPLALANDIIDMILSNFSPLENEHTWHGSCLALAELSRRGLILPKRLSGLVSVLVKSFQFEEQRGFLSVGSAVRDAACYIAWSLPRSFSQEVLARYVEDIAANLILVILFDREVNCRRAASAAFQENVGRHGNFPYGIDILTLADYHAVGRRSDCYLKLAPSIAEYREYEKAIIDHLAKVRVSHWDENIRTLSAESLSILCSLNPTYISDSVLKKSIAGMTRPELNVRHGSISTTSSIILSLFNLNFDVQISSEMRSSLETLVPTLDKNNYLKGLGGDTLKPAVCLFIAKLCQTKFYRAEEDRVKQANLLFLLSCVSAKKDEIQEASCFAMYHFLQYYCPSDNTLFDHVLAKIQEGLKSSIGIERAGFALLAGNLPSNFYTKQMHLQVGQVLTDLIKNTLKDPMFAKARVNSLISLEVLYKSLCCGKLAECQSFIALFFEAINQGLNDYSVNERGDIGAKTREQAMQSFASCMIETSMNDKQSLLPSERINNCFCAVMTQIASRIDSVRVEALKCVAQLHRYKLLRHFKEGSSFEDLIAAFVRENEEEGENLVSIKMLRFVYPMLNIDTYTYYILIGLTSCLGGLTESFSNETLLAFNSYVAMISANMPKCESFLDAYLKVAENNQGNDRIVLSFLESTALLLQAGVFDAIHADQSNFGDRLIAILKNEMKKCWQYKKLTIIVNVFSAMLLSQIYSVHEICLRNLMVFLGHKFPRLRKHTADQLFENLLITPTLMEHLPDENQEKIQSLLTDFDWTMSDIQSSRETRNEINEMFGLPPPKPIIGSKRGIENGGVNE